MIEVQIYIITLTKIKPLIFFLLLSMFVIFCSKPSCPEYRVVPERPQENYVSNCAKQNFLPFMIYDDEMLQALETAYPSAIVKHQFLGQFLLQFSPFVTVQDHKISSF